MFTEKLNQTYPLGIHIPAEDMEADKLRILIEYPAERTIEAEFAQKKRSDSLDPELLQAEIRVEPRNFPILEPHGSLFLDTLDNEGTVTMQLDGDPEYRLAAKFFEKYPDFTGGPVNARLQNTHKLMECLYVENIPMSKVTEILLQHPAITTRELKETLQLFDLMQRGVEVLESGKTLMADVQKRTDEVTGNLQHMYTGDKPLDSHPYYHHDIRPVYNDRLRQMAELKLRERGMIRTRPQSFTVTWANAGGDGWECREMTDVINTRYQDYRGMLARATQSQAGPDSPLMQLDVFTTVPRWRKDILDTVQRSWAKRGMTEITDRQELPWEITTWLEQDDAQKQLHFKMSGVKDNLFVHENGTDGYAIVDRDRSVTRFGEDFSPKNRAVFDRLVKQENVMAVDGSLFMRPAGPERVFLEKGTGRRISAFQETVNGRLVLVQPYKLTPSRIGHFPEDFQEITGRLTDARVIGTDRSAAVSCRIDGDKQPAIRLSYPDANGFKNGAVTAEQLAVKYFAYELLQSQPLARQQDKGIKR